MLFTSGTFAVFLAVTLALFYRLPLRGQRVLLLAANYIFYLWWEPRFGLLLLAGTGVTYLTGRALQVRLWGRRRLWLAVGVGYILGQLAVWKYADFLLAGAAALLGLEEAPSLGLALPVGISFYSFAAAGYLFDIYRGKLEAERNLLDWGLFLSFFPSLLSGPIPRARELLPQFKVRHPFSGPQVRRGLLRFLWGAAKKLVAADTLAVVVSTAYEDPAAFTGGQLLFAAAVYAVYIYLDFASYSDMAIGAAEMLGFILPENFSAPYLACTVKDFWRRWHISLTSWFREYLFFPLGGSRAGKWRTWRNILIVFAVSGLWHGAGLTFLVWGVLNGLYQVAGELTAAPRRALRERLGIREEGALWTWVRRLWVFALMTFTWIFFRAEDLPQAVFIVKRILLILRDGLGAGTLTQLGLPLRGLALLPVFLLPFLWEDGRRAAGRPLPQVEGRPYAYCLLAAALALAIALFGAYGPGFDPNEFVYFQF